MDLLKRAVFISLILLFIANLVFPVSTAKAFSGQTTLSAEEKAYQLLLQMTPEEKVGQLFLVTFNGSDVSETSQIHDLIQNKHIGGVVLKRENDNFLFSENALSGTSLMIHELQRINWNAQDSSENPRSAYVPLFIGVSQDSETEPYDQILEGMTPLADEMAIGATWNIENANATGKVLGQELSTIGFNLFIGPSLDVLDSVQVITGEDLGVKAFGGDPYWVGEMGKAYIAGIHEGSNTQVAVISKNFPGRGSADRPAEDEVATVRKSLEQLKQIELAPFFAVTSSNIDSAEQTDGLLVSHIRYQGFQGNIRATTRPVSLDNTALEQILSLDEFSYWRRSDGIIVSDDLGTTSIKNFFDPTGQSYDARQVVKNAFLAGNDLLYIGNLVSTGDPDNYTTIVKTLDLFLQKYQEDPAFARKVDNSVLRLLTLKYKLYPDFEQATQDADAQALSQVGISQQVTFQVASGAVTLISPAKSELDSVLPSAPQLSDRIVFISDTYSQRQCSTCDLRTTFSASDFQDAVIRLYGSSASGQVNEYRLSSYSFNDLENFLNQTGDIGHLQDDLASSTWIVFSFLGQDETAIGKSVLRRFLSEHGSMVQNKKVIGFAFNAPYYLDATDISKLTAYYGVYGKSSPFIEVAARVLFQELIPAGSLPVSVAGVGYDLIEATSPDPNQIIQLMVDQPNAVNTESANLQSTATPIVYNVGDNLLVRTGIIVDKNGHPVPDGTVVRFLVDNGSATGSVETIETVTSQGVARVNYRIPSKGLLELNVQAEPALISQTLQLDITEAGGILTSFEPTILPTDTESSGNESVAQTNRTSNPINLHQEGLPIAGDWFLATIIIFALSALFYWLGSMRAPTKWAWRWGLFTAIGGYLAYFYLVLSFPGSISLILSTGTAGIVLLTITGAIVGWAISFLWWGIERKKNKKVSAAG